MFCQRLLHTSIPAFIQTNHPLPCIAQTVHQLRNLLPLLVLQRHESLQYPHDQGCGQDAGWGGLLYGGWPEWLECGREDQ